MNTPLSQPHPSAIATTDRSFVASPVLVPRMTRRGVLIMGLIWVAYGFITALIISVNVGIPFMWAITGQILLSALMGVTSIPPWLLLLKGMHSKPWHSKIVAHTLIAPLYGVANYAGYSLILYIMTGENPIADRYEWIILFNVMIYIIQFSVFHAVTIMKELRWRERQALELSALATEQELAALNTQMNPHFLFNTLNSISAMVSRDAEETRSMIARLADLLRYTINASKKDFVLLSDEIRFTKSYLELESKRLEDRLMITYAIAPEALSCKIPPLIVQPLVENAIKHGIEPSEDGGVLQLQASTDNGRLMIVVRNTGSGEGAVKRDEGSGVGLMNITSRLRLLYGDRASLSTNSPKEGEFEVTLSLPVR